MTYPRAAWLFAGMVFVWLVLLIAAITQPWAVIACFAWTMACVATLVWLGTNPSR